MTLDQWTLRVKLLVSVRETAKSLGPLTGQVNEQGNEQKNDDQAITVIQRTILWQIKTFINDLKTVTT